MNRDQATARRELGDISDGLAELNKMTVDELATEYRSLYGEPTRSRNKIYLQKRLAWRIQELAEGGLTQSAVQLIARLGDALPERWRMRLKQDAATQQSESKPSATETLRDPRLPAPGSVLTRAYGGKKHEVLVLSDGFAYAGAHYGSLSKVAKVITGTAWNGLVFFGLQKRGGRDREENAT